MVEEKILIKHKFVPMRVLEKSGKSVDLIFDIFNNTENPILLSFDFAVPRKALIGFDPTTTKKTISVKVKKIPPYERVSFYVTVYTTNQTPAYDYPLRYVVNYHVDNYERILEKKVNQCSFRVV